MKKNASNFKRKNSWFKKTVEPQRFVYHVTLAKNRDSIMENGLIPSPFENSNWRFYDEEAKYPAMVFANNSPVFHDLFYCDEIDLGPIETDCLDFWEIDTQSFKATWYIDLNMLRDERHICTPHHILPQSIRLMKVSHGICEFCGHVDYGRTVGQVLTAHTESNERYYTLNNCCYHEFALLDAAKKHHQVEDTVDRYGRYRVR